jgi:uncharacterized membrane protein YkvA (DUF1232 family)
LKTPLGGLIEPVCFVRFLAKSVTSDYNTAHMPLEQNCPHLCVAVREHLRRIHMDQNPPPSDLQDKAGLLGGLFKQARLGWRLFRDSRVPGWVKLIPWAGLLYLLSPIDLIPDFALPGLGEVDDIVVLLIALKAFVDLSPPGIVREHLEDLFGARGDKSSPAEADAGPTIDATYRILDDSSPRMPHTDVE